MNANGEGYKGGSGAQGGNQIAPRTTHAIRPLKDLLNDDKVKARFQEILGQKGPAFLMSVLNATNSNKDLARCEPKSVLSAAMVAATLDLPIDPNLGFSAIIPYNKGGASVPVAQFQIMYKGFVQLAQRTAQYKTMNVTEVYADELKKYDPITGEAVIEYVPGGDRDNDREEKIVGYAAYFRLMSGFEKTEYWPMKKLMAHGKKYSKSFNKEFGLWKTNPAAMCKKTVLKALISKWGIMSTTLLTAVTADQAVVKDLDGGVGQDNMEYADANESGDATEAAPEDQAPDSKTEDAGKKEAPKKEDAPKKEEAPKAEAPKETKAEPAKASEAPAEESPGAIAEAALSEEELPDAPPGDKNELDLF